MDERNVYVVIPCYQEAQVIRATVEPLVRAGYEVVVVDDGSRDNPSLALQGLPVWLARHRLNLGQGAALQTGTDLALQLGAEFVVHFDADGQHDPRDIPALLAPLRAAEADVAYGSRFLRDNDAAAVPRARRLLLRAAVWVNWVLTGVRLTDAHNGFRALNRHAALVIRLKENRMAHATEIVALGRAKGLRWCEVPTHIVYTEYSQKKGQSAWGALHIVWDYIASRIL